MIDNINEREVKFGNDGHCMLHLLRNRIITHSSAVQCFSVSNGRSSGHTDRQTICKMYNIKN